MRSAMPEGVTKATRMTIWNSSGFVRILSGNYCTSHWLLMFMLWYLIVDKILSCEMKTYHIRVTCISCVCCAQHTLIFTSCILKLWCNFQIHSSPRGFQPSYIEIRRNYQQLTYILWRTVYTLNNLCHQWSSPCIENVT